MQELVSRDSLGNAPELPSLLPSAGCMGLRDNLALWSRDYYPARLGVRISEVPRKLAT